MSLVQRRYRLLTPTLVRFLTLVPLVLSASVASPVPTGVEAAADRRALLAAPQPRWPLDLPAHWLTSNFMEYRGGRFHAGIDLKTRETAGFPAYAVEDGWISRVRATPSGYGRAVYLRGVSGRTYVYAHLDRFNDRLAALVRAAQNLDGRYRVELEPAAGEFPVVRGEVLGLTGQSGTTGPHLHFEVRDEAGRPLDPLAAGFAVRDTIAPVIHHVRAVPASASARLEGGADARRLPVAGRTWAGGRAPTLHVSGPVAFSALITDGTDPAGHRLEPWLIELRVDGRTVYRRANESFDFAENAQQRLEWLECSGQREQWLHRHPGVAVAGREGSEWFRGAAGQGLSPGNHRLELAAVDRAGQRSAVAWDIAVAAPGDATRGADSAWSTDPVAVTMIGNDCDHCVLTPLFEIIPESGRPAGVLWLDPAASSAVLAPACVAFSHGPLDDAQRTQAARQGLVPASGGVSWEAASWPVDGAPLVDLPSDGWLYTSATAVPDAAADASTGDEPAMYRWDGSVWAPAGPLLVPAAAGRPGRFALSRPGLHAAMRDTLAPDIAADSPQVKPHPGFGAPVAGLTPPRWAIVPVGVRDAGSGIATGSIRARWDGRPLVVEPDLVRDRLLVEIPDSTRAGAHVLEIEVADDAGHRSARRLVVRCESAATPGR